MCHPAEGVVVPLVECPKGDQYKSFKDGKPYLSKDNRNMIIHCFGTERMSLDEVNEALNVKCKKAPELHVCPDKFSNSITFNYNLFLEGDECKSFKEDEEPYSTTNKQSMKTHSTGKEKWTTEAANERLKVKPPMNPRHKHKASSNDDDEQAGLLFIISNSSNYQLF